MVGFRVEAAQEQGGPSLSIEIGVPDAIVRLLPCIASLHHLPRSALLVFVRSYVRPTTRPSCCRVCASASH